MTTFNEFLRTRDSEHAQWIVEDLNWHSVMVTRWVQMVDFMHDHPDYFAVHTPEEMAAGVESVESLYRDYWEEQRRIENHIPLRRLEASRSRRS